MDLMLWAILALQVVIIWMGIKVVTALRSLSADVKHNNVWLDRLTAENAELAKAMPRARQATDQGRFPVST